MINVLKKLDQANKTQRNPRISRGLCAAIASVVVALYYLFCVGTLSVPVFTHADPSVYYKNFRFDEINQTQKEHYGYYNLLADAFLSGHTHLLIDPDPKLLALENPYDSRQNNGLRMHDVTLFKGKYYLYFGPVPALTLFIPTRVLGLGRLTEPYAVGIFAIGAFICSVYILSRLLTLLNVPCNRRSYLFAVLLLGFCGPLAYVLRRPIVYEVALLSGAFYVALGFAAFLSRWRSNRPSFLSFALTGLCWGLAVGCRPNLIILGAILFLAWWLFGRDGNAIRGRQSVISFLSGFSPFCTVVLGLLAYNFIRFGQFGEFGTRYHLSGDFQNESAFVANQFRPVNIILNGYNALFNAPKINAFFPFVEASPGYVPSSQIGRYFGAESVVGLVWTMALVLVGVLFVVFACLRRWSNEGVFSRLTLLGIVYCILPILFNAWLVPGITMRYFIDYSFPLCVVGGLGVVLMISNVRKQFQNLCFWGMLLLAGGGFFVSGMLGFSGYYQLYKQVNPSQFFAIAGWFDWLERLCSYRSGINRLDVVDVLSPGGNAMLSNGSVAHLIGPESIYIRLVSPESCQALLRFQAVPVGESTELTLRLGDWSGQAQVVPNSAPSVFSLPIVRGTNLLVISPMANKASLKGPVCGVAGLNFSIAKSQ